MHISHRTWHDGIDYEVDAELETTEGVEDGEHDWIHDVVMIWEQQ